MGRVLSRRTAGNADNYAHLQATLKFFEVSDIINRLIEVSHSFSVSLVEGYTKAALFFATLVGS